MVVGEEVVVAAVVVNETVEPVEQAMEAAVAEHAEVVVVAVAVEFAVATAVEDLVADFDSDDPEIVGNAQFEDVFEYGQADVEFEYGLVDVEFGYEPADAGFVHCVFVDAGFDYVLVDGESEHVFDV